MSGARRRPRRPPPREELTFSVAGTLGQPGRAPGVEKKKKMFQVTCPQCQGLVIIEENEVNCAIFRHGVFRNSGQPIPPHSKLDQCQRWVENNEIWGCGAAFSLNKSTLETKLETHES